MELKNDYRLIIKMNYKKLYRPLNLHLYLVRILISAR